MKRGGRRFVRVTDAKSGRLLWFNVDAVVSIEAQEGLPPNATTLLVFTGGHFVRVEGSLDALARAVVGARRWDRVPPHPSLETGDIAGQEREGGE